MEKLLVMILVLCMCLFTFASCVENKNTTSESSETSKEQSIASSSEIDNNSAISEESSKSENSESVSEIKTDHFSESAEYIQVMYTAFTFFKAYVLGDIETATEMMDSPDNSCLSYFSSEESCIGSLDDINTYAVELIKYELDDSGNYKVRIDIHFSTVDNIDYMSMTLVSEDVSFEGFTYKVWKVTYYDFEA